jgi:predicted transcriptional regulator
MAKRTTIRLVPPLQEDLSKLAKEMHVSYNQLVNYALARFVEAQKGMATLESV